MRRRRAVRAAALALAAPLLAAGCSWGSPDASAPTPGEPAEGLADPVGLSDFYGQDLTWTDCGDAECGRLRVPLDYDDPAGGELELAITRVPARGERIGTLIVNPGGPGGSAVEYARAADYAVGDAVRDRFDVVGLEPRGAGGAIECLTDEQIDELAAVDGTPVTRADERVVIEAARMPATGCAAGSPEMIAHVSTVDSARDLDIARAVLGEDALTYLGKSYGTKLGAIYAELFPERVGRMVLDGALPASLDLVDVTRGQAIGFEQALRDFVADCLTHDDCPLTGDVDPAMVQLRAWFDARDASPLPAGDRDLTGGLASYAVLTNLYAPDYDYPRLRSALADAMQDDDPTALLELLDARISRGPDGRYLDNSTEAFYAITCLDQPFTGTVEDVRALAREWSVEAPTFGPGMAWTLLACADWPVTAEPVRVTTAEGANPILVVSTRRDPATPYAWGEQLADELASGHLLTWEGRGHTAYLSGSGCVDAAVDAYLLGGTLPSGACD
jgi:pimeloyl-ACP methyl ester carboxylesterase